MLGGCLFFTAAAVNDKRHSPLVSTHQEFVSVEAANHPEQSCFEFQPTLEARTEALQTLGGHVDLTPTPGCSGKTLLVTNS